MSETTKNEGLPAEPQNTRWWESYLVRYFLGSIFGAICLVLLALEFDLFREASHYFSKLATDIGADATGLPQSTSHTAQKDFRLDSIGITGLLVVIGLLGLGYCYVISSPITVLHAARYGRGTVDAHSRVLWLGWAAALVFGQFLYDWLEQGDVARLVVTALIVITAGIFLYLVFRSKPLADSNDPYKPSKRYGDGPSVDVRGFYLWFQTFLTAIAICLVVTACIWGFGAKNVPGVFQLLAFGFPVLWIGIMQYSVLLRLWREEGELNRFYRSLFTARRMTGARDVRDTYTHLREHANSVFILLTELCVAALLIGIKRASSVGTVHLDRGDFGILTLCGLGLWVLPAVFIWSRANSIEKYFAERPEVFLSDANPTGMPMEKPDR